MVILLSASSPLSGCYSCQLVFIRGFDLHAYS